MTDKYRQSWEKVPEGPKPDRRPEYTPTVDEMRDQWASSPRYRWAVMLSERFADFDCMIAEVERAAAVKALREAATRWQTGAWAETPRSSDFIADRMKAAQFTTKWLNSEADRIESGESA